MAHAKKEDLEDVKELIEGIRAIEGLRENSFACFYIKNKGVLHFHITKEQRRFAHLWDGKKWNEIDLVEKPSKKLQKDYLQKILAKLPL